MGMIDNLKGNELSAFTRRTRSLETQAPVGFTSVTKGRLRVASADGLVVEGSSSTTGTANVSGVSNISGTQTISGTSTISGTQYIDGNQYINGVLYIGTMVITPTGPWGAQIAASTLYLNTGTTYSVGEIIAFGGMSLYSIPTTTNPANLRRSSIGTVQEVTSASKFKIDSQSMDLPDGLLDVPVEWWIDRSDAESIARLHDAPRPLNRAQQTEYDGATFRRVPGVIAEKVLAAGGEAFVGYDEHDELHSVSYDRFALARTAILARKLDAALNRIGTMEAKLRSATSPQAASKASARRSVTPEP